jgi:tetratricopeptide (TPR) repeat protein
MSGATRKIVLGALPAVCLSAMWAASVLAEEVATPAADSEPAVPGAARRMLTTAESLRLFQRRVERNPGDFLSATVLGRLYLRQARDEQDEDAYTKAEEILRRALQVNPGHASARIYLASALQAQHRFSAALEEAQQARRDQPGSSLALATIGDAQLELGRYEEAADTYAQLEQSAPSPPVWARLARLAELNGQTAEARGLLQRALNEQREIGESAADTAWYEFRLGDLEFKAGRLSEADEHLTAALWARPNDLPAMSGLSRVRAAQGRLEEAAVLLERVVAAAPHFDLIAELADLYALAGREAEARERLAQARSLASAIDDVPLESRHLALFYADHDMETSRAVELARTDLQARQDVYAWDTLAWALYRCGDLGEAADCSRQALRRGTQDPLLYFHAGMIEVQRGELVRAHEHLRRARDLNPGFSFIHQPVLELTLQKLGALGGERPYVDSSNPVQDRTAN